MFCPSCAQRKCRECANVVRKGQPFLTHNDEKVHKECFCCSKCHSKVDPSEFTEDDDGAVLCEACG
jgi:hypothetical protein